MKRILFFLSPIVTAILVFLVVMYILSQRSGGKGALQITSVPQASVYLNGKMIGKTPLCKCEQQDLLASGTYTLKLVPLDTTIDPYEEQITINPAVLTVVDRTFGLAGKSTGSVITLTKINDVNSAQLFVSSVPLSAKVSVDGNASGDAPLLLSNLPESDHEVVVTKDGYGSKTIRIHTVKGYKLSATIYLPVDITASVPTATPAATLTPIASPSASLSQIIILDTPTGFLRVRSTASLSGIEVAQVHPGETYPFIMEESGWLQIQLTDGKKGWISSSYAKKQ